MMVLFVVKGKAQPGTTEEFARKWQEVYSKRFPKMSGFVQACFSANQETDTWLAIAIWSAQPDETELNQAIGELGGHIASIMAGPPSAEWFEVLQQITPAQEMA
jgi:alkylhydroperoxidase/carboxymuconolactone decarboxylase family protein YurZ